MVENPLPPEVTGVGIAAGLYALFKAVVEIGKTQAERQKLIAERQKLMADRDTSDMLGEKAVAEARNAGVMELANIMAAVRMEVQDLRAQLEQERDDSRAFRAAVLEFIGEITAVLPELNPDARARVQAALDHLRMHEAWNRD